MQKGLPVKKFARHGKNRARGGFSTVLINQLKQTKETKETK
jgi:hypothetical protein